MNNKYTIVANPFTLPFEELMLRISYMLPEADKFGFIGGIDYKGFFCIAEEGKLYKAKPFTTVSHKYDTEDFDLTMHPTGWLAFEQSRTKIREFIFRIYKKFRSIDFQEKFYRPKFEDYTDGLRVGWPEEEITIRENIVDYGRDEDRIGSVFSGGGGGDGIYTVLPMPNNLSVFEIFRHAMSLHHKEHVKYIITNNNYAYTIHNSYIEPCDKAPIIDFTKTQYTCLIIEGFPHQYFEFICQELAAKLENRYLRNFPNMDYRHYRSSYSNGSGGFLWLNIFKMMHDIETDILSGSDMKKYVNDQKTIRVGITDLESYEFIRAQSPLG